jgi:acetoin utilization deacetylase AcuC-like enzyme
MAAAPVLLEHPSSLRHDTGPHPEQPARIVAIERELEPRDWLGYERVRSPAVLRDVLAAVHPPSHIAAVQAAADAGGGQLDADTVLSERSFEAATHAAGGAVELVRRLLSGEAPTGFSLHRPPGHHAERARAMGFCLFNNIAVAARWALDHGGLERVLILDWDVHHGNGTNDIFHAEPGVLFISIHQSPLYPGTGSASDIGSGAGTGYTVNLPVAPGAGDATLGSLVSHVAVPLALAYEPQLILISAGFDAHAEDPLADGTVTEAGYAAMAAALRDAAAELGVPVGGVLEGGYALRALGRSVAATLGELAAPAGTGAARESEPPLAPEASAARARLAERWPTLA